MFSVVNQLNHIDLEHLPHVLSLCVTYGYSGEQNQTWFLLSSAGLSSGTGMVDTEMHLHRLLWGRRGMWSAEDIQLKVCAAWPKTFLGMPPSSTEWGAERRKQCLFWSFLQGWLRLLEAFISFAFLSLPHLVSSHYPSQVFIPISWRTS